MDYFFRLQHLGEIPADKKYILIYPSQPITSTLCRLYQHKFHACMANTFLYYFLLPLWIAFEDMTLDIGVSRIKFHNVISKENDYAQLRKSYDTTTRSPNFFPMRDFQGFESVTKKKLALIQIKTRCLNAYALPTDPITYGKALQYLKEQGYSLIFMGREAMPSFFNDFDVYNYAQSNEASIENDFLLFSQATLSIGTSGLQVIPDVLGVKVLYINSWHIYRPLAGRQTIKIPALVRTKDKHYLNFDEQWKLYMEDPAPIEIFPSHHYCARNASEDEILEGCKELLTEKPLTPLQKQFEDLHGISKARISNYFIEKHKALFPPRAFKLNQRSKIK